MASEPRDQTGAIERDWMVLRRSRTIIGGYRVVAYGLTEDIARRRAARYKTPHQVMREPELLRIRIAALEADRA